MCKNLKRISNITMKLLIVLAVCISSALAIIGGKEAKEGEFPYQVSVQGCITGVCQHGCGGTILNKRWILTAARCIKPYPSTFYTYSVWAGSLSMFIPDQRAQVIEVDKHIAHPKYNASAVISPFNIALFHLKEDIIFNNFTKPANLSVGGGIPSGESILTGWGLIANAPNQYTPPILPLKLQNVEVPIITHRECGDALNVFASEGAQEISSDLNICTGPLDKEISMCRGDDGGPLTQNGTVVGVAIWGANPCGQVGAPSVYVKLSAFVDWINSVINTK